MHDHRHELSLPLPCCWFQVKYVPSATRPSLADIHQPQVEIARCIWSSADRLEVHCVRILHRLGLSTTPVSSATPLSVSSDWAYRPASTPLSPSAQRPCSSPLSLSLTSPNPIHEDIPRRDNRCTAHVTHTPERRGYLGRAPAHVMLHILCCLHLSTTLASQGLSKTTRHVLDTKWVPAAASATCSRAVAFHPNRQRRHHMHASAMPATWTRP